MKLADLLPKFLVREYRHTQLNRLEARLEYHAGMARVCEQLIRETRDKLRQLEDASNVP